MADCGSSDSLSTSSRSAESLGRRESVRSVDQAASRLGCDSQAPGLADKESDGRGRRATGGGQGLSAEELAELQKVDPKRAKRILANRSSAARSKVRKLRYIAELESKSAALQDEATRLHEELTKLQADTVVLSKRNEELFDQAFCLQDHMQSQGLETERLIQQVTHLQAMQSSALGTLHAAGVSMPLNTEPAWYSDQQAPAFQTSLPSSSLLLPAQPPLHHAFATALASCPRNPFASQPMPEPAFAQPQPRQFPRSYVRSPFAVDMEATGASGPAGSLLPQGVAKGQAIVDPSLLELLSLDSHQESQLNQLPHRNVGVLAGMSSLDSMASTALPSSLLPGTLLEEGRNRSLSSLSSSTSGLLALPRAPTQLEGFADAAAARQGAAQWPRHLSDQQHFQRSQFG